MRARELVTNSCSAASGWWRSAPQLILIVLLARSDRESKREQLERMVSTESVTLTQPEIERLNQTVTCAEPSSPCREAAKGKIRLTD